MSTTAWLPLSGRTLASIATYGLYNYLQVDARPTFLIDLSASDKIDGSIDCAAAFYNTSLSTKKILVDKIQYVLSAASARADHGNIETAEFRCWLSRNDQSSTWFSDILWSSTDIGSTWRVVSGVQRPPETSNSTKLVSRVREVLQIGSVDEQADHSERLLCSAAESSRHQQEMWSFDWANTQLGPIATWPRALFHAVKLALACPMAVFIYWGPSRNVIWNDASTSMLRDFDEASPGRSAFQVFNPYWQNSYERICREVEQTGHALAPSKSPGPLMHRDGGMRETFWSYNYMPLLDDDGNVRGIYGLVHDSTAEVLAEGRIDTLLKVNEAMGTATDLSSFWQAILAELEENADDIPLAAVYSMGSAAMIDQFSNPEMRQIWQASSNANFQDGIHLPTGWILEGKIGFPTRHVCTPSEMHFYDTHGLATAFRQAMATSKVGDITLCTESGTLPSNYLDDCENRGLGFQCTQLLACPLQRPSGGVIAWLVLGINPRRVFDDEYKRFTRLLSRHIESKLVLILTLEREKRFALQSAEDAAYQQQQLSLQIQEQRRELEQSHSRFLSFAKQAQVGVYILGDRGEVKFCNDAWCRIFDMVPGATVPKPWLTRAHPDDIDGLDHQWDRCLDGYVQEGYEWRVLRPGSISFNSEDDIIYLESCALPEMAEDGTMTSVTGLVTDVTIRKAYQREQAKKLDDALEEKRVQEYFMDMVSHEMRNPLNAILQCAEETSLLIEKLKEKTNSGAKAGTLWNDIEDMVNTVLYCGLHQKQLIDDVLTLSKLDSKLLSIYPVEVHPASLLDQATKVFSSEIRASRIEISTSLENSIDGEQGLSAIMLDPSRILQILINLISNAIKFLKGREKRELHVALYVSKQRQSLGALHYISSSHKHADPTSSVEWGTGEELYLYFSVQDTGPGMSSAEMSSLFTRFRQGSPRTHVKYGGSGLGLFISRELTELHGGEIGLMSEVEQGSTFAFYVKGRRAVPRPGQSRFDSSPRIVPQHEERTSAIDRVLPVTPPLLDSKPLPQSDPSLALHVLVVEDNDINRRVLKRQLGRLGYQVTTAIHGAEALAILQKSTWWEGDRRKEDTQLTESYDERKRLSVILCDLEMPVMDGIACVRHIRQWQQEGLLHPDIPVIAVTGNARAETTLLAAESDFDHVISKPYSFKTLVEQMLAHADATAATAP